MIYEAKVTVYDGNDDVVITKMAQGATEVACNSAAGALRDRLERTAESTGFVGANGIIEVARPVCGAWFGDHQGERCMCTLDPGHPGAHRDDYVIAGGSR